MISVLNCECQEPSSTTGNIVGSWKLYIMLVSAPRKRRITENGYKHASHTIVLICLGLVTLLIPQMWRHINLPRRSPVTSYPPHRNRRCVIPNIFGAIQSVGGVKWGVDWRRSFVTFNAPLRVSCASIVDKIMPQLNPLLLRFPTWSQG